jgi:hypothetical protein
MVCCPTILICPCLSYHFTTGFQCSRLFRFQRFFTHVHFGLPDQILCDRSQLNCLKQVDCKHSLSSSNSLFHLLSYSLRRCTFCMQYIFVTFTFVCRSEAEVRLVTTNIFSIRRQLFSFDISAETGTPSLIM